MPRCHRTVTGSPPAGRSRRSWSDYTTAQRGALLALGAVEVGMAVTAWADLARRDSAEVRGPKWVWALVIAINIIGPLAYFRWGRLNTTDQPPRPAGAATGSAPPGPLPAHGSARAI